MTKDEALRLALDWFKCYQEKSMSRNNAEELANELITTIKAALEAKDEYLAYLPPTQIPENACYIPPQHKPLTDEEIWKALSGIDCTRPMLIARAIEVAHGIEVEA